MPPNLPIDLETNLKKRARRRLVGAIALVLIMLVILPIILQDRTLTQTEAIKITMPEPKVLVQPQSEQVLSQADQVEVVQEASPLNDEINQKVAEIEKVTPPEKPVLPTSKPVEKPAIAKTEVVKPVEVKPTEAKPTAPKPTQASNAGFTIQIGVYSDMANVKQIQDKLTQAGLTSKTEKVVTPKGEKIRLNAGSFSTREAANDALVKLQKLQIAGFVKAKS